MRPQKPLLQQHRIELDQAKKLRINGNLAAAQDILKRLHACAAGHPDYWGEQFYVARQSKQLNRCFMIINTLFLRFGSIAGINTDSVYLVVSTLFAAGERYAALHAMRLLHQSDPANGRWAQCLYYMLRDCQLPLCVIEVEGFYGLKSRVSKSARALVSLLDQRFAQKNPVSVLGASNPLRGRSRTVQMRKTVGAIKDPSVAVMISGQLRFPGECLPGLRQAFKSIPNAVFFLSTWDAVGTPRLDRYLSDELKNWLAANGYPSDYRLYERLPQLRDQLEKKEIADERFVKKLANFIHTIDVQQQPETLSKERRIGDVVFPDRMKNYSIGSLPMFYKINRCMEMVRSHEEKSGEKFDVLVRVRPDMLFDESIPKSVFQDAARTRRIYLPHHTVGHCDDQLAIGGREAMVTYCSLYPKLPAFWNGVNDEKYDAEFPGRYFAIGEQLLFQYLLYSGIELATLNMGRRARLIDPKFTLSDFMKCL